MAQQSPRRKSPGVLRNVGPHPLRFRAADGLWRLGSGAPLDPDGVWLVDSMTIGHGWATRRGGRPAHVGYATLNKPLPPRELLPGGDDWAVWGEVRGFELDCLTGRDRTLRARYRTSTKGGLDAIATLMDAIVEQRDASGGGLPCAEVWLGSEPGRYSRSRGLHFPQFEIVGWADWNNWKRGR